MFSAFSISRNCTRKLFSTSGFKKAWVPSIMFFLHAGFLVDSGPSLLPPISNPAEWSAFCNSRHGLPHARQFLDEWKVYENRGDKLAATAFSHVMGKYSLLLLWVTTLAKLFTSNKYWAKLMQVLDLAVYCDGVYGGSSSSHNISNNDNSKHYDPDMMPDVLEVSIFFPLRLTFFGVLRGNPQRPTL